VLHWGLAKCEAPVLPKSPITGPSTGRIWTHSVNRAPFAGPCHRTATHLEVVGGGVGCAGGKIATRYGSEAGERYTQGVVCESGRVPGARSPNSNCKCNACLQSARGKSRVRHTYFRVCKRSDLSKTSHTTNPTGRTQGLLAAEWISPQSRLITTTLLYRTVTCRRRTPQSPIRMPYQVSARRCVVHGEGTATKTTVGCGRLQWLLRLAPWHFEVVHGIADQQLRACLLSRVVHLLS